MRYAIKEIFYSLQGEGARAGRPAVFVRFAGCNLWNGRDQDRESATCKFCDTDFVGGTRMDEQQIISEISRLWPDEPLRLWKPYVILTGGEPLLQADEWLVSALKLHGFWVAVETNGTIPIPRGFDWVTVSPKMGTKLACTWANELKVVYPQEGMVLEQFAMFDAPNFYLQPMDGLDAQTNREECVKYCLEHPRWMLSLQQHKILNLR